MSLTRRGIIGAIICAPAIVRASSLMPIKALKPWDGWVAVINKRPPITDLMRGYTTITFRRALEADSYAR